MDTKFLVFKLPRTGSSMLGKVLNSHPNVYCKNEFLNPLKYKAQDERIEFFNRFFSRDRQEKDRYIQALGATLNPFKYKLKVSDFSEKLDALSFDVILLLRRNYLLQARSFYIVKEITHGLRFQLGKQDRDKAKNIKFDFDKLEQITKRFEKKSEKMKKFVEKIYRDDYLTIYYEDLVKSRQESFAKIFERIGVSQPLDDFDYNAGREKVLSHGWKDICQNFEEINNYPYLKKFLED